MAEHVAWFSARADEYLALNLQTGTAAFQGQWRKAQDSARRSIDLASRGMLVKSLVNTPPNKPLDRFWSSGAGLPKGNESQLRTVLKTQTNKALTWNAAKK
jgi:hypothetical protein